MADNEVRRIVCASGYAREFNVLGVNYNVTKMVLWDYLLQIHVILKPV